MLELYRASAGSGKTYNLAKKYIKYLITISEENRKTRLRTYPELADSAKHILAITFTNKATNEMQMRIVESLNNLAFQTPEYKIVNGRRTIVKPVYMQDFIDELKVSVVEIAKICRLALSILLENYSDFNVSTIDSFFQQVLRTFAYESEINDSYQVELDNDFLSELSVDATLEEIDNNSDDSYTKYWIQALMDRTERGKWNIFTKSKNDKSENPYMQFINSVKKMETEQYKHYRKEIEDYFERNNDEADFVRLYEDLYEKYDRQAERAYQSAVKSFRRLYNWMPQELHEATGDLGKFQVMCTTMLGLNGKKKPRRDIFPEKGSGLQFVDLMHLEKPKVKRWLDSNPESATQLIEIFKDVCSSFDRWKNIITGPEFRHWKLYSANMPYFALFGIVNRKRQEYLDESNSIQLAETASILKDVIGDTDTPFVYERLGTRLNHFLIDEFQDTSRMQWDNLAPLLSESMSRGNDNLVIGDAKQSIYRFRNADPSIIMKVVPETFEKVVPRGMKPEENTNYRSDLHLVQFNNSFFKYLAHRIDNEIADPDGSRMKFEELYANVAQRPNRQSNSGYVELRLFEETASTATETVTDQVAQLAAELIERGYKQRDICVLVSRNKESVEVSKGFVKYNNERNQDAPELKFVSEKSLLVASSRAVGIIISVLHNLAKGSNPEIRSGEESRLKGVASVQDILANFKFFQMQNPGKSVPDLLDEYFAGEHDFNALSDMLAEMQSLAIPAIVESVVAKFIDDKIVREDALYISAFQDLVLEYCESHPTDIGSFLKWWERKSKSASVVSPEDTDAIRILTIHKAKGLEYPCVIVPFANWNLIDKYPSPKQAEWLWVTPDPIISHDEIEMPPYIPVSTSSLLEHTVHQPLLQNYFDLVRMDVVNRAYVAFTRAEHELYIFASLGKKTPAGHKPVLQGMGNCLYDFCNSFKNLQEVTYPTSENIEFISQSQIEMSESPTIVKIGRPLDRDEIEKDETKRIQAKENAPESVIFETYTAHPAPDFLKYRAVEIPEVMTEADVAADEQDLDPRSEGNIKHAVLERVNTVSDLEPAVRHLSLAGLIPPGMEGQIKTSIEIALKNPKVKKWFDGSGKLFAERYVLEKDKPLKRPDRLLVYPDGTAMVIDYKFGRLENSAKYHYQVRNYIKRLRHTGSFTNVEGYLWYVNENHIEQVE